MKTGEDATLEVLRLQRMLLRTMQLLEDEHDAWLDVDALARFADRMIVHHCAAEGLTRWRGRSHDHNGGRWHRLTATGRATLRDMERCVLHLKAGVA